MKAYVRSGEIGLSGNYLNMTELVSAPVLNDSLDKMQAYGKKTGHPIVAGMSADINGLAWGYADALYNHGVRYFTPLCIPINKTGKQAKDFPRMVEAGFASDNQLIMFPAGLLFT